MDKNASAIIEQVASEIQLNSKGNPDEFRAQLIDAVETLLQKDFPRLIQILYRLDVDEVKLKAQLKNNQGSQAAELIADLIFERQLQKLEMRKRYGGNKPASGEEHW